MLMEQSLSRQSIIDNLHVHYSMKIISLTLLSIGADNNASIYKAVTEDNSSYFVKLKRGHDHDIGITILQLLHEIGVQQIIPPIKTSQGNLTQNINNFTLILYPFIEGENGFTRSLTGKQWLTLGRTIRQVHDIDVPSSIKPRIRQESFSSKWRDMVRALYTRIEAQPTGDQIALKLLTFMKKNLGIIQRLVDRADELAQILQNNSSPYVLCHSDIHGGNVLVNNNTIYVVDWDSPIMAPKERDLMFIGGGVANVWNKPHEEALFYKGYGKTDINKTILTYYRHERIVEDIAEYGQELLLTTEVTDENKLIMYQHFTAMFEPNGVIDIAFKTDDIAFINEVMKR